MPPETRQGMGVITSDPIWYKAAKDMLAHPDVIVLHRRLVKLRFRLCGL